MQLRHHIPTKKAAQAVFSEFYIFFNLIIIILFPEDETKSDSGMQELVFKRYPFFI